MKNIEQTSYPTLDILKAQKEKLLALRDKGLFIYQYDESIPAKKYVKVCLGGEDLPTVKDHKADLLSGILVGEILVNHLLPQVWKNCPEILEKHFPKTAIAYLKHYQQLYPLRKEPIISRTDMLLTAAGLKALEINPDAPEGCTLSYGSGEINKLNYQTPDKHGMWRTFVSRFAWAIQNQGQIDGYVNAVIPFWPQGEVEAIDAAFLSKMLKKMFPNIGITIAPITELEEEDANKYNLVLRITEIGTQRFLNLASTPYYASEEWLKIRQYPHPVVDLAGLKHLYALLYRGIADSNWANKLHLSPEIRSRLTTVMLPTYAIDFSSTEEIARLITDSPGWVVKEIFSSHGDGFINGDGSNKLNLVLGGDYILQQKAEAITIPVANILNPDGEIMEQENLMVDMDPMAIVNNNISCVNRLCQCHPMNALGPNGGGLFTPIFNQ